MPAADARGAQKEPEEKKLQPLLMAVVGLPSAGKSSMVNSIVAKRILQTGVCRTTKEVHLIGKENLFNLPGNPYPPSIR